ncbi:MAG: glycosyltransferase family 4 protein [Candidatus Acidiferrales bacterium]
MIVGLFPDLLPVGGVQTAGRHTAAVLARIAGERGWASRFLSLNDPNGTHVSGTGDIRFEFEGFARSKPRFTTEALRSANRDTRLVLAAHPNLAVPALAMRARAHGFRLVVLSHGVEVWKPLNGLRRACLRRADLVFAPSRDTARKLQEVQGIAQEKIRVLHWGLDPSFFDLVNRAPDLRLPKTFPEAPYVLSVGRWSSAERYKGLDTLIQVLPELLRAAPELHLVFVGEGDDRPALERLASDRRVSERVHFVSGISREELVAAYARAEIFALPSGGEGFGFVFLEAMALGKAVVGGNHGGIPDIIEDGVTGFLVEHGNVAQLAEKILVLLTNQTLRDEMGRRGRERVLQSFGFGNFESGFRDILVSSGI